MVVEVLVLVTVVGLAHLEHLLEYVVVDVHVY